MGDMTDMAGVSVTLSKITWREFAVPTDRLICCNGEPPEICDPSARLTSPGGSLPPRVSSTRQYKTHPVRSSPSLD